MSQIDVNAYTAEAVAAYQQGNLSLVGVLCDVMLRLGHGSPLPVSLAGLVAFHVGEYKRAVELLGWANAMAPGDPKITEVLDAARKGMREQALRRPDGRKRYLVIKAWGYGFCSDLDHVLGALLLADMTGRTPIVHWGEGSLFRDEGDENAWDRFFEPVSKATLADVVGKGSSYFPPKWNDENVLAAENNKFIGPWSRVGGPLYLNRREDVAVIDLHLAISTMHSWIRPGSPLSGKDMSQLYRLMVKKYLKLRPEVAQRVDDFAKEHFTAKPIIGVHARGGDKPVEDEELSERNKQAPALVDGLLAQHPGAKVFLLTDDVKLRDQYAARYGERLITTDCLRTSTAKGLHYIEQESRSRLGVEVLVDMYLAARCDYFVGVGTSNVSAMIEHLKDWPAGSMTLLPYSIHYNLNPFLYRYRLPPEEEAAFLASVEAQKQREAQG